MASKMQIPELKCMDPENYRKFFRSLCWSGTRKTERPYKRKGKKDRHRRLRSANALAVCYAPALLANPSQFAVYATVRRSVLARWMYIQGATSEYSDDSDSEETTSPIPSTKIPKITGIGLRTVFTLVSQSRFTNTQLCEHALNALLDVLQGHAPEELAQEPTEIIASLQNMLVDVATGRSPDGRAEIPTALTGLGSSCLISLAVARGEAELILNAVSSLIMSSHALSEQNIKIPVNLTTLQRCVQSIILGTPSRNLWLNYGVPHQSLVTSFPVDLPQQLTAGSTELVIRALVSDGCYLYVFTSRGLLKIGSGYGSSIKQHVYLYKPDFFPSDRHGWLGCCKNKLYVRIGRKKTEVYEVDKDTLDVRNVIKLDPGSPAPIEPKSAVFSDGHQLGMIMITSYDNLTIRLYDVERISDKNNDAEVNLKPRKELTVPLMRRRTLALGRAAYEDGNARRGVDLDATVAMQLDDNEDDPLVAISTGQDFGLLQTASGKVYYTGKGLSLGYKAAPQCGRWTLMKETMFNKNDTPNFKKFKVVQISTPANVCYHSYNPSDIVKDSYTKHLELGPRRVIPPNWANVCRSVKVALGHEGLHAILVLDNGAALFTGLSRRGEDGDNSKHRRAPKPTRPKKIYRAEGYHVVFAACNYGSTALVTKQGALIMYGKDTQHCDPNGFVQGLRNERIVQVALGKAHAVALTNHGLVFTFGINNKGQCGRDFGYARERHIRLAKEEESKPNQGCQHSHKWATDSCRICVQCLECTSGTGTCDLSIMPGRMPGDTCGCGEGDSGCLNCGICRQCAEAGVRHDLSADTERTATDDEEQDSQAQDDTKSDKVSSKTEGQASSSDVERDANLKVSCLPPAKIAIPGGHKVTAVACGLQHTVLLTEIGEVLTFGSNQFGQLGAGDLTVHHRIIRVRVPKASAVAAGSNHTAVMTRDGELYTFGNYQKGALGRPPMDDASNSDRAPIWYATPGRIPRLGHRNACKALWISASGDQTFVQVSQSLIKTDTLFSSTIIANTTTIIILPNQPEHTFKCITINKVDGVCTAFTGPEQIDFVNTLACLDPLYDVIWCYQPQMRVMKCFNILAFDSHKLQRCCNPDVDYMEAGEFYYPNVGCMKRLEDFKNLETFELTCSNDEKPVDSVALSNVSILNQELAIPSTHGGWVTRMHAALHLLGCLDSLTYVHDNKFNLIECKRETITSLSAPLKADYLTVARFDNHGGGWGYSGHSVEAIRFMCDNDILLGGIGLFGGRGDYTAKVKLFDIGHDGGDQEGDGELIAESEEVVYECAPRDKFPIMFDAPIPIIANRWYVAWACINGPSSDCGSAGQAMVINDDVGFHFKTSKKSNNGTDVNAGQIPCLLYNIAGTDHALPPRLIDIGEPIISLSKNLSRKVSVPCFKYLISLLSWSWDNFKEYLLDTNGQVPINYQKLTMMKHQKRLVYVIRACLRLIKSYINEIYPQNVRKRNSHECMSYFESIGEVKSLIQSIIADSTPSCSMLPKRCPKVRAHRVCFVQFALELTSSVLKQAHDTATACFHAFFPTPTLKWNHLSMMLYNVTNGVVPEAQVRELTVTCASLCASRSLRDVLHYIVPLTQISINSEENKRPESKIITVKEGPSKSATVPRSSHAQKPPPIPPRAHQRDNQKPSTSKESQPHHNEWHLLDIIPILLDIVMIPIKKQMMTRQCGQPHDHGEIKQHEQLSEYCCKLCVRIVAELSYSATNMRDLESHTIKQLLTPSRFMRVNQSRSWNTGNGSPDAICFTVDRPGVMLVGACVFGGSGTYEYSLELLHDMRQTNGSNDDANSSNCWVSIEMSHGSFTAADCQNDMAQLKFDKPVALKEDLRYAIRLCNHGSRTANGDCGLPSVKGPDGTTFRFASCSLSFNGTTLARGQIPCLIYYGSRSFVHSTDSADVMIAALRAITLRVSSIVLERSVELFYTLRNELTAEDLRRNASVLQQSPAVNTLIPYTLANLEGLDDAKSVIKLLELIYKLMPHVAAMNLLVPSPEDFITTTTNYYTWVECEHPYRQAGVTNSRVLFPPNVSWVMLELDPRCITAQPEDTLTIYAVAGVPKQKCHCQSEIRVADPPFRKVYKRLVQLTADGDFEEMDEDPEGENACMHYNCTYVSVTPKLANIANDWPQKAILVPGNEVIFSLETTSDYLAEYNKTSSDESRFGFRCLCSGYEDIPLTSQRQGLVALEMELVYAGASCSSKLLAPDLDVPPMVFSTLVDVQLHQMSGSSEAEEHDSSEALLLSRGLELSSPLTVHQVIEGQPLLRCVSTERQFLIDFIAGAESTAGGRLARWLAPTPRVEPSKCELKAPTTPATLGTKVSMPILVRDQYGDLVASPSLVVEVVIQKLENTNRRSLVTTDGVHYNVPDVPFSPSSRENSRFLAITMMKAYSNFSFEELRYASGTWGETVASMVNRVPAERLVVRPTDGYYVVQWTPKVPGVYAFRCTLDNIPIAQELTLNVTEISCEKDGGGGPGGGRPPSPPPKLHRFNVEYSAGLRVRASPCLQSEELGKVPPGEDVSFIEEISNKDGTWVRLSVESLRAYTDGTAAVAWCMQYHRHLEGTLLEPVEPESPQDVQEMDYAGLWTGYSEGKVDEEESLPPPTAVPPPPLDIDEPEPGTSQDPFTIDDSRFPFSIEYDADEPESGPSQFSYAPEPSKRDRQMRNEAAGSSSPRRRSNGNEWWSPVRHRPDNGRDVEPIPEVDIEPDEQPESQQEVNMYRDIQAGVYRDIKGPRWRGDSEGKPYEPLRRPYACPPTPEPPPLTPVTPRPDPPSPTNRPKPEPSTSRPDNKIKEDQNQYKEDMPKFIPEPQHGIDAPKAVPSSSQEGKRLEPQMLHKKTLRSLPEPMDTTWSPVREVRRTDAKRKCDVVPQKLDYELDNVADAVPAIDRTSSQPAYYERVATRTHPSRSPPPLPARTVPVQAPPPRKHALSPAQAECLRAIFAALLWHEGTVHDAIACAAFLKFHPQLPKQGARVVTRPPHDVAPPRQQRHSVEVSNAGKYLQINPSTLETLTRSGIEASTSRARKGDVTDTIKEEDHAVNTEPGGTSTPGVVNVLPPALRALVALWDALYDSDQLSSATDKYKKPLQEFIDVEPKVVFEQKVVPLGAIPKKIEWKAGLTSYKAPYSVRCELCGGASVPPPLAAHMRHLHPGCRAPTTRGFDRNGIYKRADPPPAPPPTDLPPSTCGQLAQACQLWYIFCERCRDKAIKTAQAKQSKLKASLNSNEHIDLSSMVDHHTMKENAVFLLDLAPLTNSESISTSPWHEGGSRGPPTPPGSMWQPAPPFQCLTALGAAPKAQTNDTARYHSLGRPAPPPVAPLSSQYGGVEIMGSHYPRVHRSVSMGQAGGRDLANAAMVPLTRDVEEQEQDTLSGAGSSLLAQPSAELQRLVGCGVDTGPSVSAFEPPTVDPESLIKSPVLSFVLAKRDLPAYRQKMDAAVRINTVRQYAFEAMNWLLRSTTQPTCVHDVMWWFCTSLDKYARVVPPPSSQDDNKENVSNEPSRLATPTASTSAICPGGRSARGSRAAFHAFLGSVSALAPSLTPASAALLQAVRCWSLHYSHQDRAFLHRSQVFSVISKILSHPEDGYEDGMMGALHESFHSYLNKENLVWSCPDVTGWCDISVSSRQGMAGSLTDGSTETFWESGDEDRNKAKWIQVAFAAGAPEDRPHIICLHVDNTRDTLNKILLVSFLYSGGTGEMYHMQDMEIDPKAAAWLCYTLPTCYPGVTASPVRVRCELRGPEPSVRVRQLRVLASPALLAVQAPPAPRVLRLLTEADTLRVFRLLTSQVFGKLLEFEQASSDSGEGVATDDAPPDDTDLREHVVGILFAGHQLTSLQRQVMSHIVCAIGAEAARVRDDWETALICADTLYSDEHSMRPFPHQQDNYCFEMLSLLLALSGSKIGRSHLAQQTELLGDLLALLHTGSERVQRQVISLLRRMIIEIPPQKMLAIINQGSELNQRVTLLDHLLSYLGKAIYVQMKVKGSGGISPGSLRMASNIMTSPDIPWFMRGNTTKNHAQLVAKLISDMAEEKVSLVWGIETRTALANYASQISQLNEGDRRPERCVASPTMWMTLAALCVCEQSHIELLNGSEGGRDGRARDSVEPRPYCANHDDGTTTALVECRTCGALCAECDRFLHLNRSTRAHHRQICKEEESAIRIDIHEGCGRAKLFWLLLLVDRRSLKGLAEFRMEPGVAEGTVEPRGSGPPGLAGICRFCGTRGNTGLLAIGNVCADQQCQEYGAEACNKLHVCEHLCGGVRGERKCLPCLSGCSGDVMLRQDADDMCMICFTDPLQAAPAIQLGCGHVFHLHCCKKALLSRWIGPRITFSFSQCPICKEDMSHWTLDELLTPIRRLREEVQKKALMRLEYEGLNAAPGSSNAQYDPTKYAMERYAYYVCHKCEKAYFGGLARCEAESNGIWEPSELVCGGCSDVASAKTCPKHGADFLEYKCRYCCSVAVFFCFGTSHFCNACHDDFQRVTNIPRHLLPQCPAGPKCEQLPGTQEECPLHVNHPPTGEEFALGCGVCRHAHTF